MKLRIIALLLTSLVALTSWLPGSSTAQEGRGVVRIRVRVKQGDTTKGLARKRFYLFRGSLEQNQNLIKAIEGQQLTSRDCFYAQAGASDTFIKWLRENDCETVYCREPSATDVASVKEFASAVDKGAEQFGSRETARKWLSVNLPEQLRSGFYKHQQSALQKILSETAASPQSVMTDRNGTAFFTDLEPGTYTLSNLTAVELGASGLVWNCEVQVKPGDLATEKPYLISNRKDKNVKCVAAEKVLPACPSARAALQR